MEESCTERHDPSRVVGLQLMYVWYMYEEERGEANESVGEGEKKLMMQKIASSIHTVHHQSHGAPSPLSHP